MQSYDAMNIAKISRVSDKKSTEANPDPDPDRRGLRGWPASEFLFTGGREVAGGRCGRGVEETAVAAGDEGRLLRRRGRQRIQRLRRALRDSGDKRRQLRAPELAPLPEQGSCIRPPTRLIWMGLAPALGGPLLMMASSMEARVVSVP